MKIIDCNDAYIIHNLVADKDMRSGRIYVNWEYKLGEYFLICLYNKLEGLDINRIEAMYIAKGISDNELTSYDVNKPIISDDTTVVYILSCRSYENLEKGYAIEDKIIKKNLAYEIQIFSCRMSDNGLEVFRPRNIENICVLPRDVYYSIEYKPKLFSKWQYVVIIVYDIAGYTSGAVSYRVEGLTNGLRPDIPLSSKCIGHNLYLKIPRTARIKLYVKDEYKDEYRIIEG